MTAAFERSNTKDSGLTETEILPSEALTAFHDSAADAAPVSRLRLETLSRIPSHILVVSRIPGIPPDCVRPLRTEESFVGDVVYLDLVSD